MISHTYKMACRMHHSKACRNEADKNKEIEMKTNATIKMSGFHGSKHQANLVIKEGALNGCVLELTPSQWRKFMKCTCGTKTCDCQCGGSSVEYAGRRFTNQGAPWPRCLSDA